MCCKSLKRPGEQNCLSVPHELILTIGEGGPGFGYLAKLKLEIFCLQTFGK